VIRDDDIAERIVNVLQTISQRRETLESGVASGQKKKIDKKFFQT
jgi:hypothetical protein